MLDVFDPLEGFNRAMYNFNAGFDRYFFLPIVRGYELVTPDFVEDRVSDFFNNLREVPTFANSLLQLKGETAGRAAVRFVVNTMFTARPVRPRRRAGHRRRCARISARRSATGALGAGPFLVLPVLGPSNFRDATGTVDRCAAVLAADPQRAAAEPRLQRGALRPAADRHPPPAGVPLLPDRLAVRVRAGPAALHRDSASSTSPTERPGGWRAAATPAAQPRLKRSSPILSPPQQSGGRRWTVAGQKL